MSPTADNLLTFLNHGEAYFHSELEREEYRQHIETLALALNQILTMVVGDADRPQIVITSKNVPDTFKKVVGIEDESTPTKTKQTPNFESVIKEWQEVAND